MSDRWCEEEKILRAEMEFVPLFMNQKADQWARCAMSTSPETAEGVGLRCYALRQKDMWLKMRRQAIDLFAKSKDMSGVQPHSL